MGIAVPALTRVEQSLYLTLCGRALDSRSPHPYLGDTTAGEIVTKIGYDVSRFPMPMSKVFDIAVRAKRLDELVRRFVGAHPDAVVLELGAGLDSRMARVAPPSTVDWYDLDLPAVIDLRRQVLPPPANAHGIGADVADPHWLDQIPADRPAMIVADGLIAFLAKEVFVSLLNRLTNHFPSGELALNGYTRFHMWAIKHYRGTDSIAEVAANPGFDDPHDLERWAPRLRLLDEIFLSRAPEVARMPTLIRLTTRLAGRSTAISRRGTVVLHYGF